MTQAKLRKTPAILSSVPGITQELRMPELVSFHTECHSTPNRNGCFMLFCCLGYGPGTFQCSKSFFLRIKEALDFDGFYQRPAHGLMMLDVVAVSWIFLLYRCIPHCQVPAGWSSLHTNRGFDGLGAPISVDKYTVAMTHWPIGYCYCPMLCPKLQS